MLRRNIPRATPVNRVNHNPVAARKLTAALNKSKRAFVEAAHKKKKKNKKRRKSVSFTSYIYKVLKLQHKDRGISSKAMCIMNNFVSDTFERLTREASTLVAKSGKKTLTETDLEAAVKFIMPDELGNHAIQMGRRAINNYESSA
jgi:histone H2B